MKTIRAIFLSAFAAVALLAAPAAAQFETPTGLVQAVRIDGNRRVETEAIRVHIDSRLFAPVDPEVVQRDVLDIYSMGFFDDVQVSLEETGGRTVLVYTVVERPLIKAVRIEGHDEVSEEDLEAAMKVRPYTILDLARVAEGVEAARKLYDQEGYKDAKITYRTEPTDTEGEVDLVFEIVEGEEVSIAEVVFEGNEKFSDRQLSRVLETKEAWFLSWLTGSGTLDPEVLKSDVERLTAFYYESGYVQVKVAEPVVERTDEGIKITMKLEEGDQYKVGTIGFEGDLLDTPEERLRKAVDLEEGETFQASKLRSGIFTLTEAYGDRGYAFANVEPLTAIDPEAKAVNVGFRIDKGPEVYFNRIEIAGNTKTQDEVIRRELHVKEQGRFSGTLLKVSRERVERLGFFDDVNLTTQRGPVKDQIDLVVDVKERQTGAFTAGAGFSSADRFIFNARISENNLFGSGNQVAFNVDIGSIRQDFSVEYTDPYFLDTYFTASARAFDFSLDFDDFDRRGRGVSLQLLYPFTALGINEVFGLSLDEVRFGIEYKIEQAKIDDIDNFFQVPSIEAEEGDSLTSSIIPTLRRNTLNHPFDPTDGSFTSLSSEFAALGGDTKFIKVDARTRSFFPLYRNETLGTFVGSLGARLGWGLGQEGRNGRELPLFERFFPGGISSIRGYRTRSLGPREPVFDPFGNVVDDTPIGGSSQMIYNAELIFPIVESLGLRGVLFFDAGNAYSEPEGLDFGSMRYAAGWGVRWLSPIGPLRIEIGYPLDPEPGDDSSVFQFSFGAPL